jgi:hypothetical protein
MARIATAYSHLRPYDISRNERSELERLIAATAKNAAARIFQMDSEIDVFTEVGSLKTWVKVIGGVITIYGGFRDGIERIVNDARTFSEIVNEQLIESAHAPPYSVFRTERRLETPGRILRTIHDAEHGPLFFPEESDLAISDAFQRRRRRVINILRDLDQAEKDAFLNALPKKFISRPLELELRAEAQILGPIPRFALETDNDGTPRLIGRLPTEYTPKLSHRRKKP